MSRLLSLATLLLGATQVLAQTYTSCNPLNSTCPSDMALGTSHTFNWTTGTAASASIWNTTAGTVNFETTGAEFTINAKGDSPTIKSNFYIFFGQVSVIMRCAKGTGIVSSIVLESDDLDEVDWEFIGGNSTSVETNYFGKGNTTSYDRAIYYGVDNPQENYHNYTTIWTSEKLEWYIDSVLVRTLNYDDAVNGKNYPQTPMTVRLGIWAGGDSSENSNGTVEWAGGETNYKDGPFTMIIDSIYVADYSSGSAYTYGDTTGDYSSIKIATGNSTVAEDLNKVHGVKAKFSALPKWAQIVIVAGICAVVAIALASFIFCCIKSRKAGRKEHAAAEADWEKHQMELAMLKQRMRENDDDEMPLHGYDSKNIAVEHTRWL